MLTGPFQFLAKENSITNACTARTVGFIFSLYTQFNYGELLPCNNELWVFTSVFHLPRVGKEIKAVLLEEINVVHWSDTERTLSSHGRGISADAIANAQKRIILMM